MGEELDRLGITEDEVQMRYERVILKRAAEILQGRVPKRSFGVRLPLLSGGAWLAFFLVCDERGDR